LSDLFYLQAVVGGKVLRVEPV